MDSTEEKEILKSKKLTLTPTIKRRRIDLELQLEKKQYEDSYASCCSRTGRTDARLLRYISKTCVSILILIFAGAQLVRAGPCDSLVPFYCSLITLVMGSYIKLEGNNKSEQKK